MTEGEKGRSPSPEKNTGWGERKREKVRGGRAFFSLCRRKKVLPKKRGDVGELIEAGGEHLLYFVAKRGKALSLVGKKLRDKRLVYFEKEKGKKGILSRTV